MILLQLLCSRRLYIKVLTTFLFVSWSFYFIGCAASPSYIKPGFEDKPIKTLALMPVTDKRTDNSEDLSEVEEMLTDKLLDKDYNVIPPASVKGILKEKLSGTSVEEKCSLLKADGVIFTELFEYNEVFYIDHSIKFNLKLFDAQGDSLWMNNAEQTSKPFLWALGYSVGWSIGIAINSNIESDIKPGAIGAGVGTLLITMLFLDAIIDQNSQAIDQCLYSLPDGEGDGDITPPLAGTE